MKKTPSLSVSRHGKTTYTGVWRDLTECAIPDIRATIDGILAAYPNTPLAFLSSPKERAVWTAEVWQEILIEKGAEVEWKIYILDGFRAMDIYDRPRVDVIVNRVLWDMKWVDDRIRIFDAYYAKAPEFDNPENILFWELRSAAEKRFITNLLLLAKETQDLWNNTLHRILITHFELLNGNLSRWFGLDGQAKWFLRPAEVVHFEFFPNKSGSSLETRVVFREEEKIVQLILTQS